MLRRTAGSQGARLERCDLSPSPRWMWASATMSMSLAPIEAPAAYPACPRPGTDQPRDVPTIYPRVSTRDRCGSLGAEVLRALRCAARLTSVTAYRLAEAEGEPDVPQFTLGFDRGSDGRKILPGSGRGHPPATTGRLRQLRLISLSSEGRGGEQNPSGWRGAAREAVDHSWDPLGARPRAPSARAYVHHHATGTDRHPGSDRGTRDQGTLPMTAGRGCGCGPPARRSRR
jgi:hypothetical protein